MPKRYIVRDGYVVTLVSEDSSGNKHDRTFIGGDAIVLDDDQAKDHLHKLEFADKKDRDAALAAEAAERAKTAAANPAQLIADLVAALSQAQAQVAPADPEA